VEEAHPVKSCYDYVVGGDSGVYVYLVDGIIFETFLYSLGCSGGNPR
jgi:hypothetical protein